jgi:hypothetical protein
MKALIRIGISLGIVGMTLSASAQSNFSVEEYGSFLGSNQNLPSETLLSRHAPKITYFKSQSPIVTGEYAWLDSVEIKYGLTSAEKDLLFRNGFVVTERLSFPVMTYALHDIYGKDLPVFVTTDAILHALHDSYDKILRDLEMQVMRQNLAQFLDALSAAFPQLVERYGGNSSLKQSLEDLDLYITMARSLLAGAQLAPQYTSADAVGTVWKAVQEEKMVQMPLFSERPRKLDFSQFTVRGHYSLDTFVKYLGPYFKCMMWLGRTDFLLTPPPAYDEAPWSRDELRRMGMDALLLNELMDRSGQRVLLEQNDRIITFLVGESDNLTPAELAGIVRDRNLAGADALLDNTVFDAFQKALYATPEAGQRILSDFFIMDPFAGKPDPLPVSFRLMGQKFIIDSYIFSNVVYDRIVNNGQKVWRPLPDPLDAMFVLGNDDALPLLKTQLDKYKYSSQLSALRYLADSYDDDFWGVSLYNTWLSALRTLNAPKDPNGFPYFMRTAAWRQEKLNTQLASWSQLRHDNLLYAKQSYTGGTLCSYPHSFVEPYPEFYKRIALFAEKANDFFSTFPGENWRVGLVKQYFPRLRDTMIKLEAISRKELNHEPFSAEESEFLQKMLFQETGSGAPPFSGWYGALFYEQSNPPRLESVIVDVHTQPTDEGGAVVGNVLHVGTGMVNLGIFLAESPSDNFRPMAFVGPVMSYYEKVTGNFERLTDEQWTQQVTDKNIPSRPDWVNIYLADAKGSALGLGRELPGVLPTGVGEGDNAAPHALRLISVNPNPFNPITTISYLVPAPGPVTLAIYDILGRKVVTLTDVHHASGMYSIRWDARNVASGMYFCRIQTAGHEETAKLVLVR